jgi:hypothetical protein
MNREEWEAKFKEGGAWLTRFHAGATRIMAAHQATFWPVVVLAFYGLVRVFV